MLIFQRTSEAILTRRPGNVYCWDMARRKRGTDCSIRKVLHSRDIRFNENEKASEVAANDDVDHPVILDFSSDYETEPTDSRSPDVSVPEQVLRRSTRERHQPNYYGREQSHLQREPTSSEEASPDSPKWMQAMETEMRSLKDNEVWELVELPAERKTVGSKWVYKVKTGADGSVECYKASLVAQGFNQMYRTDYDETFCPVVRQESLRVLLALSVQNGLKLHQVDVTTAGNLEEEIYMTQPKGFVSKGEEHLYANSRRASTA